MERSELRERRFTFQTRTVEIEGNEGQPERELWVEGCAVRFDAPTVLFEYDGVEYSEQIASGAFDECRMDDVIFNYNHSGKVMARTRNSTLLLEVREDGLYVRARLDGTEEGRRLYDEISKGYIDRMSFRFLIGSDNYDNEKRLWTVYRIKKLWDVAAVDIPAYDDTIIEARKADAAKVRQEFAEAEARRHQQAADAVLLRKRKLALRMKL